MVMQPVDASWGVEPSLEDSDFPGDRPVGSDSVVILPRNYTDLLHNGHHKLTHYPQFRNSRTGGSRSTRAQFDHDVFEGLPVRHWRKRPINVSTAPEKENTNVMKVRNLAWPELEMPRDYHLLSEMSQNLLRAARMPQAKKSIIAPLMEDDKETGEDEDADGEIDTGFIAKRWAVVPKDLEGPEPEYLAKRRKGLPSIHSGPTAALGTTQQMRKTKIRKLDTSGGSSVLEVLVPEGQSVDGEIFEEETSPIQAPAPGTVVEGVGVANAEGVVIAGDQGVPMNNRRRPPPPKRKAKGPSRSKKKKVAFAGPDGKPISREPEDIQVGAIRPEGDRTVDGGQGISEDSRALGDETMMQEGEEESEEGSEGEEGEEGDREEGKLSPSPGLPTAPSNIFQTIAAETKEEAEATLASGLKPPPDAPETANRVTERNLEAIVEPAVGSDAEPTFEATDSNKGEALPNAPMDGSDREYDHEPTNEPFVPPVAEIISEPPTEMTKIDFTGQGVGELMDEPSTEPTASTEASMGETAVEETEPATQEPPMEITMYPPQDMVAEPMKDSSSEIKGEDISDSMAQPLPDLLMEAIQEAEAEPSIEPMHEHALPPAIDVLLETSTDPPLESVLEAPQVSVADHIPGLSVGIVESSSKQLTIEEVPGSFSEPTRPSTPQAIAESFTVPTTQAEEEPVPHHVEKFRPGPVLEPVPPRVAEAYYEAPVEPVERRFSFTRPTASPKAPTPSPPTPIEDKFSLRAPYVSPKAPTMSPPTPIDRSMLSSPDIPLAEQQFELPPPIDVAHEGDLALAPHVQQIPDDARTSVEAAPPVDPQLAAQIPVEHDPLDGMVAPQAMNKSSEEKGPSEQAVIFSDGEEDLLGSLERSLDQRGRSS